MQSSSQIITTNKPTPQLFTGRMPFLSPNQQCQSTEGKFPPTFHDQPNFRIFSSFLLSVENLVELNTATAAA